MRGQLNKYRKNKMTTTIPTIEKVLDNAFAISRKGTKHRNEFKYNSFRRPVTHLDFFQLLHNSNINLDSFELTKYMCHLKATNYTNDWISGNVILEVSATTAQIIIIDAEWMNINLNRSALNNMFSFFQDNSIFHTDFGELTHSDKYYKL